VGLRVDQMVEPGEVEVTREVVCHSDSVVVLPRLGDCRVLLAAQFRPPCGCWNLRSTAIIQGLALAATTIEAIAAKVKSETITSSPAFSRVR
jgi:hypothetical protein